MNTKWTSNPLTGNQIKPTPEKPTGDHVIARALVYSQTDEIANLVTNCGLDAVISVWTKIKEEVDPATTDIVELLLSSIQHTQE